MDPGSVVGSLSARAVRHDVVFRQNGIKRATDTYQLLFHDIAFVHNKTRTAYSQGPLVGAYC